MRLLLREHARDPYLLACAGVAALALYHLYASRPVELPVREPAASAPPLVTTYASSVSSPPVQLSRTHLKMPGEWYVDPTGAPGSDARTLAEIASRLRPGDRVRLAPGEYHGSLRVDFDLEIVADRPKEVVLIGDSGPAIDHVSGRLKLTGLRLQQTTGEAIISRGGELDLNHVTFQARAGGFAWFERANVRGESVFALSDDASSPAVERLVDTAFDCAQCGFEHVTLRASGERAAPLHLEDPVFRQGGLMLSGRVDATLVGGTFLGLNTTSIADSHASWAGTPPRSELSLEEDATLRVTNAIFDRSGVALADRASADVRSSKFNSTSGPVVVARGKSGLRLEDSSFAIDPAKAIFAGPEAKVEQRK